ncbi:MAG: YhcH/YjgK/YiaL family protein [Prevotella sp.]|nr:YhcH/YjgK/YiaL family protein [Prevotella sp.]
MIIDNLNNLENYLPLNPLFALVVEFIKENDLNALEPGKHAIKGDDVFVNIQVAKGKTVEEAVLETHQVMTDIQVPISSKETYGYTPASELPEGGYDAEKDMALFPGEKAMCHVTCQPGMFAIFFPQDGHAPCISQEKEIKKAIFKVKN